MKDALNEPLTILTSAIGTNNEMRNASRSSLVPNLDATMSSLPTDANRTTAVRAVMVRAALTIPRRELRPLTDEVTFDKAEANSGDAA